MIVRKYPRIMTFTNLSNDQLLQKVMQIKGFKEKTASLFVMGLKKFAKFMAKLPVKIKVEKRIKAISGKLQGHKICFTGFRNADLEKEIEANGGKLASGVNRDTTILLYAPGKNSSKMQKAQSLGIKMFTEDQFKKKFNL